MLPIKPGIRNLDVATVSLHAQVRECTAPGLAADSSVFLIMNALSTGQPQTTAKTGCRRRRPNIHNRKTNQSADIQHMRTLGRLS